MVGKAAARRPVCVGTGLVVLDAIYGADGGGPRFLAGGSCGNVMAILSHLGWDAYPAARLGDDPEGRRVVGDMRRWGARTAFVEVEPDLHTPRIIEQVERGGRVTHRFRLRCGHGNRLPRRRPYTVRAAGAALARMPAANVFYFDRAGPGALEMALRMKARGAAVFFEPHKPSGGGIFARCLRAADIVKHCGTAPGDPQIPLEIQTMGEDGLRYRRRGTGSWARLGAFPVHGAVDTAGSGDWLSAGLIHRMFGGGSARIPGRRGIESALRFGGALAAANCSFVGARGLMYSVPRDEMLGLAGSIMSGRTAAPAGAGALRAGRAAGCRVCLCEDAPGGGRKR